MADAAAADRRRPVPAGRADLAAAGQVPARHHQGGRGRPAAVVPAPDPGRRRCGDPDLEEPRPVRRVRGDRPVDGRGLHGTGSRDGSVRAVQDRLARRIPRGQGRRHRGDPRDLHRAGVAVAWVYAAILFEPLPVGGWIAIALLAWLGLAAWAALTFLGSDRAPARPRRRPGSGSARWSCCRSPRRSRTSAGSCPVAWPPPRSRSHRASPVDAGDALTSVVATVVLIALALGGAVWSFARQEL